MESDDGLSGPVLSRKARGKQRAVPESDAEQSAGTMSSKARGKQRAVPESDAEQSAGAMSSKARGKQPAMPDSDAEQSAGTSMRGLGFATGPPSAQVQLSKRRRGVGLVTPNACNECRKKRVKCDGRHPCGRCLVQSDVECVYELPVRKSKEDLRSEIEDLRRRQRYSDTVLFALGKTTLWERVLKRLQKGETIDNISDWIDTGELPSEEQDTEEPTPTITDADATLPDFQQDIDSNYPSLETSHSLPTYSPFSPGLSTLSASASADPREQQPQPQPQPQPYHQDTPHQIQPHLQPQQISNILQQPNIMQQQQDNSQGDLYATSQAASTQSGSHDDYSPPPQSCVSPWAENADEKAPSPTWTEVSSDLDLVQHLLALYFCWEYPTFASLSKEHFLVDFHDGRPRYCSPILVNALLALGCRFSSNPDARANPLDPYSSGDHFFKECLRLLHGQQNHYSITTIQALGIMAIREASCGRDSESWYYAGQSIRLAVEMKLHLISEHGDEGEIAVKSATFWGAFALDHAWSLATGSLPQCSCFPNLPPKPAIIDDIETSIWTPYTDYGVPLNGSDGQSSNVRSVYKCFCELSELVHESLYILHSPGRALKSTDILHMYTKYLHWYNTIPDVLRLGSNYTPAVLFAHMYYHFAILLLFRPLIKLRIIGSSIMPKELCLQAADAIQKLLRSYSMLYTLQRTPSFVPYFVLTSAIMHLSIGAASYAERPPQPQPDAYMTGGPQDHLMGHGSSSQSSHNSRSHERGPGHGFATANISGMQLDPSVIESINQGIADLTEMVPCHHFAEQALNILRFLAKKWNIHVQVTPVTMPSSSGTETYTIPRDRPTVARPAMASSSYFEPTTSMSYSEPAPSMSYSGPNGQQNGSSSAWDVPSVSMPNSFFTGGSAASVSLAKAADNLDAEQIWLSEDGRPAFSANDSLRVAGFEPMQ